MAVKALSTTLRYDATVPWAEPARAAPTVDADASRSSKPSARSSRNSAARRRSTPAMPRSTCACSAATILPARVAGTFRVDVDGQARRAHARADPRSHGLADAPRAVGIAAPDLERSRRDGRAPGADRQRFRAPAADGGRLVVPRRRRHSPPHGQPGFARRAHERGRRPVTLRRHSRSRRRAAGKPRTSDRHRANRCRRRPRLEDAVREAGRTSRLRRRRSGPRPSLGSGPGRLADGGGPRPGRRPDLRQSSEKPMRLQLKSSTDRAGAHRGVTDVVRSVSGQLGPTSPSSAAPGIRTSTARSRSPTLPSWSTPRRPLPERPRRPAARIRSRRRADLPRRGPGRPPLDVSGGPRRRTNSGSAICSDRQDARLSRSSATSSAGWTSMPT